VKGTGSAAGWLFVLVASVYLLTAAGRFANYDAESMFAVTRSLYERGSLDVGPCVARTWSIACVPGVDGRFYSGYGVVPSVAAVPFYAAGRMGGTLVGFNQELAGALVVSFMNSLAGALACVALFLWAVKVGCTFRQSVFAAILLAFATPFWFHSTKEFYSEPLFTLFLVGSFAALSRATRTSAIVAGVLFGLAAGTRVFGLIYVPIAAVYALLTPARSSVSVARDPLPVAGGSIPVAGRSGHSISDLILSPAAAFLFSVIVCLIGVGIVNLVRFGSPLNTGYHVALPTLGAVFSTPILTGLRGSFFDPDVGLVWFAPLILLLPLTWPRFHREHRLESLVCLGVTLSTLLFFSAYTYWHGGWAYGPRLLTPLLPFLILPLASVLSIAPEWRVSRRLPARASLVLIPLAMAIQLVGLIPPYTRHYYLRPVHDVGSPRSWWHASPLLENVEDLPDVMSYVIRSRQPGAQAAPSAVRSDASTTAPISVRNEKDRYLLRFPNSINLLAPDIWWLKAGVLGTPWRFLIPIAALLCVCALVAGSRLGRINA
jgi:hypothetical protein